jgi:hypothetical protein
MNAKRTLTTILGITAINLMTSTGAFAATATNKVYSSGLLVLLFLGFCALVVVAQLIPAMITLVGMVKAVLASRKEEARDSVR